MSEKCFRNRFFLGYKSTVSTFLKSLQQWISCHKCKSAEFFFSAIISGVLHPSDKHFTIILFCHCKLDLKNKVKSCLVSVLGIQSSWWNVETWQKLVRFAFSHFDNDWNTTEFNQYAISWALYSLKTSVETVECRCNGKEEDSKSPTALRQSIFTEIRTHFLTVIYSLTVTT